MARSNLIEPSLLKRLELLSLSARQPFASAMAGDRRSLRRGLSVEFADFREYRPGDDLRYVDWKAYGRLEKLFLKLFLDEEDLNVHMLIDSSRSMAFGSPLSKWNYAQRAAAAIGFIALNESSRVDAAAFNMKLAGKIDPLRGATSVPTFLRALEKLPEATGETRFADAIRQYAASAPPAGLVIVFSDFFDPAINLGLAALSGRRHQVVLVQVLDRAEVDPDLDGDFCLVDSETGETHEVTLTQFEITEYQQRLAAYSERLVQTARKYNMDFFRAVTDEPVENLVLQSLRKAGIVK